MTADELAIQSWENEGGAVESSTEETKSESPMRTPSRELSEAIRPRRDI